MVTLEGGGEFGGKGGRGAVICGFVPLWEVLSQAVSSGIRCRKQRDLEEQSVIYWTLIISVPSQEYLQLYWVEKM